MANRGRGPRVEGGDEDGMGDKYLEYDLSGNVYYYGPGTTNTITVSGNLQPSPDRRAAELLNARVFQLEAERRDLSKELSELYLRYDAVKKLLDEYTELAVVFGSERMISLADVVAALGKIVDDEKG